VNCDVILMYAITSSSSESAKNCGSRVGVTTRIEKRQQVTMNVTALTDRVSESQRLTHRVTLPQSQTRRATDSNRHVKLVKSFLENIFLLVAAK